VLYHPGVEGIVASSTVFVATTAVATCMLACQRLVQDLFRVSLARRQAADGEVGEMGVLYPLRGLAASGSSLVGEETWLLNPGSWLVFIGSIAS